MRDIKASKIVEAIKGTKRIEIVKNPDKIDKDKFTYILKEMTEKFDLEYLAKWTDEKKVRGYVGTYNGHKCEVIKVSKEETGVEYIVEFEEFPNIIGSGDSPKEAITSAKDTLDAWFKLKSTDKTEILSEEKQDVVVCECGCSDWKYKCSKLLLSNPAITVSMYECIRCGSIYQESQKSIIDLYTVGKIPRSKK